MKLQNNHTCCPLAAWEVHPYLSQSISQYYLGEVEDTTPTCTNGRPGSFVSSELPCRRAALCGLKSRSCCMSLGSTEKTVRRSPFSFWQDDAESALALPDCCSCEDCIWQERKCTGMVYIFITRKTNPHLSIFHIKQNVVLLPKWKILFAKPNESSRHIETNDPNIKRERNQETNNR